MRVASRRSIHPLHRRLEGRLPTHGPGDEGALARVPAERRHDGDGEVPVVGAHGHRGGAEPLHEGVVDPAEGAVEVAHAAGVGAAGVELDLNAGG